MVIPDRFVRFSHGRHGTAYRNLLAADSSIEHSRDIRGLLKRHGEIEPSFSPRPPRPPAYTLDRYLQIYRQGFDWGLKVYRIPPDPG